MPSCCGELAVDLDFQDPAGALLVARDVGQLRQRFELVEEDRRPVVELVNVDIDERVLVLGLGNPRANRNVLRGLHVQA